MKPNNKIVRFDALKYAVDKIKALLFEKVDVEEGKGLSTNDYTNEDKAKLDAVAEGAQVNVLEKVSVDGTALEITDKGVNIDLSGKVDKVDGMGLSHNDLTDDLVTKINNAAGGNITLDYESLINKPVAATAEKDGLMSKEDKAALDAMGTTIDTKIATELGKVNHFAVVDALPEVADAKANTFYMVPKAGSETIKDEYILIDGEFVKFGSTDLDLSGFVKTEDLEYVTEADVENLFPG